MISKTYAVQCDTCHRCGPSAATREKAEAKAHRKGWSMLRDGRHTCYICMSEASRNDRC